MNWECRIVLVFAKTWYVSTQKLWFRVQREMISLLLLLISSPTPALVLTVCLRGDTRRAENAKLKGPFEELKFLLLEWRFSHPWWTWIHLVWSLRPFSISTYSDRLNTDRLRSSIGSVVVVVMFGFFGGHFLRFKKGWFWFLWRRRSHDSSAATDQPIGAMQSDSVTI